MASIGKSASYLTKNPYGYCFRIKVPKDLFQYVGKKELKYSLKTGRLGTARQKARLIAGKIQWLFMFFQHRGVIVKQLNKDQIQMIISRYVRKMLDKWEIDRVAGASSYSCGGLPDEINEDYHIVTGLIEEIEGNLVECRIENVVLKATELLEKAGIKPDIESIDFRLFCREVQKAELNMYKVERRRMIADYSDDVDSLFPVDGKNLKQPLKRSEKPITLKGLVDEYWKRKEGGWGGAAQESYERYAGRLFKHFGQETTVDSITYENMVEFRDKLKETGNKGKPVTIKTVNLHLEYYSGLFNHAKLSRRIAHNPVDGVKFSDRRDQQKLNDPFTKDDLMKLFYSDQYNNDTFNLGWKFWLPILLLFTGARLEELCQLYIDEIKQVDGLWIFDIDETREDQSVKAHEKRYIPLHPLIVDDLNFIKYAHSLPDQGGRLFPELKPIISKPKRPGGKKRVRYGHYPSTNWFPPYKEKCGVTSPPRKKTIHSFRHSVSSCLMEHDVQEYVIAMALGHKHPQISTGRYGKKFEPELLMEKAYSKLDFHEKIDLSHLKKSKFVIKE